MQLFRHGLSATIHRSMISAYYRAERWIDSSDLYLLGNKKRPIAEKLEPVSHALIAIECYGVFKRGYDRLLTATMAMLPA